MSQILPEVLIDKKTLLVSLFNKQHTWYTHLICIIIRLIIGVLIYNQVIKHNYLLFFVLLIFFIFIFKFIQFIPTWKVYLRTVLVYGLISILIISKKNNTENLNHLFGILIIVDALMGLQSRHIVSNMFDIKI